VRQFTAARMGAVASILCALILFSTDFARAGDPIPQAFDIRPQSLGSALTAFARQSQQEILFSPDLTAQKSSSGVSGVMPPLAALGILLDGSGLSFTSTRNGAILIFNLDTGSAAASNTFASAPEAVSGPDALSEVIVSAQREAQRAQLAARVAAFVDAVTAFAPGDAYLGLAQWHVPVCPLVLGLPQEQDELIRTRISEIARAARVPLAGEHCRPNLYVYVTGRPEDLLHVMAKRDFAYTFGADALSSVVDEFMGTARPVRVWYSSSEREASGKPFATGGACPSPNVPLVPVPVDCNREPSRLLFDAGQEFARIFVIADQARLHGVTLGQFADYVAMVGLAKITRDARVGDAPTILKLFTGAPQAAPAGMSDWDEAYLKSLYATEQRSRLRRSQIARRMVREIAP
jgi:hypothetical protein